MMGISKTKTDLDYRDELVMFVAAFLIPLATLCTLSI